jgi:radical SAM protein (TIGR01212 family)
MRSAIPEAFRGRRYNAYNDWAKAHYGGRLQKISVDAGFTCPNRDGTLGFGGCSFCNNAGFSPSYLRTMRGIAEQIDTGVEFARRRYPRAKAFLAYFQTYSNTYAPRGALEKAYGAALIHPDIAGLVIGTRPDCLPDETLDYLADLSRRVIVELEIGIESCDDTVLEECRRGHDFACARDAILRTARRGLFLTAHLLIGLPLETEQSLIKGAEALAALPIDAVKFHQLQILRDTRLSESYLADPDKFPLLNVENYLDSVIGIVERLPPDVKIQRLGSEVPPKVRISPDWGMRLDKFPPLLEDRLRARGAWQGRLYRRTGSED